MNVKDGMKFGIGISIGIGLVKFAAHTVSDTIIRKCANSEGFMNYEKTNNPELYEKLRKYTKE